MESSHLASDEIVCFGSELFLKAVPSEDGGRRFVFFEASNEGVDQQGERVLAKALKESAEHYLKFGNVDIDHFSLLGSRAGVANPKEYEIGQPVDVVVEDSRTFVKAELYRGDSALAKNANMVWDSLTKVAPPHKWYPSVGGAVLAKSEQFDPETKAKVTVIDRVRWTNVGLSRTPVNQHLPTISTAPVGVFSKSFGAFVMKTLEAGYGTDSATLTGGGALRVQSLHGAPLSYLDLREQLAALLRSRDGSLPTRRNADSLSEFAAHRFGLTPDAARRMVERFFSDLHERRTR